MKQLLLSIEREIEFSAKPVLDIFRDEDIGSYTHISTFLKNVCSTESDAGSFKKRWCSSLSEFNRQSGAFEADEMSLLMNFGSSFGNGDISSGTKLIRMTVDYLEKSEAEVRLSAEKQGKLQMLLPVYAGMVICILLI